MGKSLRLRTTLRRALCAALVGAGCGGSTVTPDAGAPTDIGSDIAVDRPDVTPITDTPDVGVATPDAPDAGSVGCVIDGGGPLAVTLRGSVNAGRDAGVGSVTLTETLDLYLPMGRVAGAPVVYAFESSWPFRRLETLEGTLDDTLGNGGLEFMGYRGGEVTFTVRLVGPDRGALMDITRNLNFSTDVPDFVSARVALCPDGAPAPTLHFVTEAAPSLTLELVPTAPIAAGLDGVTMTAGGAAVPASVAFTNGVLTVSPTAPWPVNAEVALDVSSLRDPLGRAFSLSDAPTTLRTTTTLTDLNFDAPPPEGAVAPPRAVSEGRMAFSFARMRARTLVSLGDLGPAARVALRYQYACGAAGGVTARLVAADGRWSGFTLATPSADNILPRGPAESVADVPASGPLWLVVEQDQQPSRPGWGVPLSPCAFLVDSVGPATM